MNRHAIALALTVVAHTLVLVVPVQFSPTPRDDDASIVLRFHAVDPPPEPPTPEAEPPAPEPPPPTPREAPPVPDRRPPPQPLPSSNDAVDPPAEPSTPEAVEPPPPAVPLDTSTLSPTVPSGVTAAVRPNEPNEVRPGVHPPKRAVNVDLRSYAREMRDAFLRHRRYPPAAVSLKLDGTAKVRVAVDRQGNLVGTPTLVRSSGHAVLDEEALRVVRVAAPFSPLPREADKDVMVFVIPIDFRI